MGKVSPQASQSEVISAVTDGIVSHITDPSGELYIRSQPLQQTARTFIESRLKQEIDGKTIADTIYDAFKLRTQGADQKTITKLLIYSKKVRLFSKKDKKKVIKCALLAFFFCYLSEID